MKIHFHIEHPNGKRQELSLKRADAVESLAWLKSATYGEQAYAGCRVVECSRPTFTVREDAIRYLACE